MASSLVLLNLGENHLTGQWVEESLWKSTELSKLILPKNRFSGTWPREWLLGVSGLSVFDIALNRLEGTFPQYWLLRSCHLRSLFIHRNRFSGLWFGEALGHVQALLHFEVNRNAFAGTWPEQGLSKAAAVSSFRIHTNSFAGSWGADWLCRVRELKIFEIGANRFTGVWPERALTKASALELLGMIVNRFTGSWSADAFPPAAHLLEFRIKSNLFSGAWPVCALSRAALLTEFGIGNNKFAGTIAGEFLRSSSLLEILSMRRSRFAGTWPDEAGSAWVSMGHFDVYDNRFAGAWPDHFLSTSERLNRVQIQCNAFRGTWPGSLGRLALLRNIAFFANSFSGSLPSGQPAVLSNTDFRDTFLEGSLPTAFAKLSHLRILQGGNTWIEGTLPSKLAQRRHRLQFLSLANLPMEGRLPTALGRMSGLNVSLVLSQSGLLGPLPAIAGTLLAFSVFENSFEGHLPELRLARWSYLVGHSNILSCRLPEHGKVKPALALVLLGNRFKEPFTRHPAWVLHFERGNFFTVTDRSLVHLALKILFGSCSVVFLGWTRSLQARWVSSVNICSGARYLQTRVAYQVSVRMHSMILLQAIAVMLAYLPFPTHTCMTVIDRLRLPCLRVATLVPRIVEGVHAFGVFFSLQKFCKMVQPGGCIDASFPWSPRMHRHRDTQTVTDTVAAAPTQPGFGSLSMTVQVLCKWICWLILCFCLSSPAAIYSTLKTVPGFLQPSKRFMLLITQIVALSTSFLTSVCLPFFARRLPDLSSSEELLSIGNLLALPVVPFLVTFIFSEDCLGQWVKIWRPCLEYPSPLDGLDHILLPYYNGSFAVRDASNPNPVFNAALVSRDMLCESTHVSPQRCLSATLERSMLLLLGSSVHLAFSGLAIRAAVSRRMKLLTAWVHMIRIWTMVIICGSSIPLLCFLSLANFLAHNWFLFGGLGLLRTNRRGSSAQGAESEEMEAEVDLPHITLDAAVTCFALLELAVLAFGSRRT